MNAQLWIAIYIVIGVSALLSIMRFARMDPAKTYNDLIGLIFASTLIALLWPAVAFIAIFTACVRWLDKPLPWIKDTQD